MSVLIEAISLVVTNAALERRYPGGVAGFRRDCPNHTFCTDGHLTRVGFMSLGDTRFFLGLACAAGLAPAEDGAASDIVVVDQNTGPMHPCLWLEFGHTADGVAICWHAARRPGKLHVPFGWDADRLDAFHYTPDTPFPRRLRFVRTEDCQDWYQDGRTGELLCVDRTFVCH